MFKQSGSGVDECANKKSLRKANRRKRNFMAGFAIILFMLGLCLCWVVGTKVKDRSSAEKPESSDSDEESVAVRRVQEEGPAGSSSTDGEDMGWASATEKEDEGEEESDVGSGNNDDFVGLKERSHVPADSETSAAPADPSSKERAEGLKREEMKCSQLGYYRGPMLIVMVVEMRKRKMRKRKMRKKKKKERTGRSMEEND